MRTPSNVVKRFVACGAPRALRQRLQWQWWQRSGVPSTRKATPPHRQLPRGVPVPGSGGGTSGRTVVSTPGGKASKRGRSSGMSYHGALEPTKMCPTGRTPGSSSKRTGGHEGEVLPGWRGVGDDRAAASAELPEGAGRGLEARDLLGPTQQPDVAGPAHEVGRERGAVQLPAPPAVAMVHELERTVDLPRDVGTEAAATNRHDGPPTVTSLRPSRRPPPPPRSRRSRDAQPIDPRRRAAEERGLLVVRMARRQPFENVPERRVAARQAVHREVAFEHAARRPEGFDAGIDVGLPLPRQILGGRSGRRVE